MKKSESRGIENLLCPSTVKLSRVVDVCLLVLAALASHVTLGQAAPPQSKSRPGPVAATLAVIRNQKDMTSGSIVGGNWMVTFHGMPADWTSETDIANQIGIQEMFHPQKWNQRQLAPSIMISFSHKEVGDESAASNMKNDVKRMKANNPRTKVISAPDFAISATEKAPVRIFEYQHGWDRVIYSEDGDLLFVSTLHCTSSAQCAPFGSILDKFVKSLDYTGNVKVIDKRKHHE